MTPRTLAGFLAAQSRVVAVRVARVRGSAPREEGAQMFVAPGATFGTIGGGQLEYMAIEAARAMLARGELVGSLDLPLGPEIGQCCGGRVELTLARMGAADRCAALAAARNAEQVQPHVYIMGAGHTGRALARALQALPVRPVLVDNRPGELAQAAAGIETRLSPLPEAEIAAAPPGSAFVVLTHDHGLDFLLTSAALARGDAAYVGMIGSATKRAKFRAWCRDHCDGQDTGRLTCPIGAQGSADKRPEVIAAFVAAEVLAVLTAGTERRGDAPQDWRGRAVEEAPLRAG